MAAKVLTTSAELTPEQIQARLDTLRDIHDTMPLSSHDISFTTHATLRRIKADRHIDHILDTRVATATIDDEGEITQQHVDHQITLRVYDDSYVTLTLDGVRKPPALDEMWNELINPETQELDDTKFRALATRRMATAIKRQRNSQLFAEWIAKSIGTEALDELTDYNIYFINLHPDILDAFHEEDDIRDVANRLFGVTRKDLIKAILNTEATYLNIAYTMYERSMPIDAVVRFLNLCTKDIPEPQLSDVSRFRDFSTTSRRKMLSNFQVQRDAQAMVDMVAMIQDSNDDYAPPTKEVKHFAEAESHIVSLMNTKRRERLIARADASREQEARRFTWLQSPAGLAWQERQDELERERIAEIQRLAKEKYAKMRQDHKERIALHEKLTAVFDDHVHEHINGERLTIKVARDVETLDDWSEHLGTNCIGKGGYDRHIEKFTAILLGIYKDGLEKDNILYTAEIQIYDDPNKHPRLTQFRGYNNKMPEHDEWFEDLLIDNGITITNK